MEVCINPDILHETVLVYRRIQNYMYVYTSNVVLASELPSYADITLVKKTLHCLQLPPLLTYLECTLCLIKRNR